MARIRALKPKVSQEEALELLSPRGYSGAVRNLISGPVRSVACFYIPYRIFQVEIQNAGEKTSHVFGLDAVNGSLDLYTWEHLPTQDELFLLETRNRLPTVLPEEHGQRMVTDKVRRLISEQGFFRVRNFHIAAEAVPGEIHVPYWAAFRGDGIRAHIAVLDAVRRQREGFRVRQMLHQWLTSIH